MPADHPRPTVPTSTQAPDRATRWLRILMAVSIVVSIVHYADNYLRFDRYALTPNGLVTEPLVIPTAWLVFTVIGVLGYVMYTRRRWWQAVACLAVYSLSGLVSVGHYTEGPPSAFNAVQNVLIVTDLLAGLGIVAFALWLMLARATTAGATA